MSADGARRAEEQLLSELLPYSRASSKCSVGSKLRLAVLNYYSNTTFLLVYPAS